MPQSIFITGAASGIGRATARLFASRGWLVGLADINAEGLNQTAAELPAGQSVVLPLDVRDRQAWAQALAAFAEKTGGGIDVVFNNAGVAMGGAFESNSLEAYDRLIDVNFKGVVNGAHLSLPYLKAAKGCLLNTGSASGLYGSSGLALYSATKFAVRGLTEALDIEFAPHGVRVRSLMPSFIDTPLLDMTPPGSNRTAREAVRDASLEFTPVEDVAHAAWAAVHGDQVHVLVGKTAKSLGLWTRLAPHLVRNRQLRMLIAARARHG